MAIEGVDPLDNDNASSSFGVAVILVRNRVSEWFDEYGGRVVPEPDVIGYILALRFLVQAEPKFSSINLRPSMIKKWKQQYQEWIDKFGSKVRVKRGVDRELMWENALKEFDLILESLTWKVD